MQEFSVRRCYKPEGFGPIVTSQVHHFSDASETGYGAVYYLRLQDQQGHIHCSFIIGKARVAPVKAVTIPRLELAAATVAARLSAVVRRELELPVDSVNFWTDSTTVLRYINNTSSRFKAYVANRIGTILDLSSPGQWNYVGTHCNPADEASRGCSVSAFLNSRWIQGPQFLWETEDRWPKQPIGSLEVELDDPEVKKSAKVGVIATESSPTDRLLEKYSDWHRLKRAVAYMLRFKSLLKKAVATRQTGNVQREDATKSLQVEDLVKAEMAILKYVQSQAFSKELHFMKEYRSSLRKYQLPRSSPLYRLNPILMNGLLVVGGRLHQADQPFESRHPVIVPGKSHVTDVIIDHVHKTEGHQGRQHVLSCVREKFWILHANANVRRVLKDCTKCRRLQGRPLVQQMADLPPDRVRPDLPFSSVGVDCFGPFYVKRGRGTAKRYGVLFTCLSIRAVHIEVVQSLSSDSFINALRRFISRRGKVKEIRSDNGTNFVGAQRELKEEISNWNQQQIETFLVQRNIEWNFNAPGASHQGGVWERQIRTVRKILNSMISSQMLDDEGLSTLLCEVEYTINSRPLTTVSNDHRDLNPITPNQLLLLRSEPVMPPGHFSSTENYSRRRWKQVQHLASEFWKRWRKEYLQTLQQRQKWNDRKPNLQDGDVVLIVENDTPRNLWKLGRVTKTFPDQNGLVRTVELKTQTMTTRRPVNKLVLLVPTEGATVS